MLPNLWTYIYSYALEDVFISVPIYVLFRTYDSHSSGDRATIIDFFLILLSDTMYCVLFGVIPSCYSETFYVNTLVNLSFLLLTKLSLYLGKILLEYCYIIIIFWILMYILGAWWMIFTSGLAQPCSFQIFLLFPFSFCNYLIKVSHTFSPSLLDFPIKALEEFIFEILCNSVIIMCNLYWCHMHIWMLNSLNSPCLWI